MKLVFAGKNCKRIIKNFEQCFKKGSVKKSLKVLTKKRGANFFLQIQKNAPSGYPSGKYLFVRKNALDAKLISGRNVQNQFKFKTRTFVFQLFYSRIADFFLRKTSAE